jgi:hypothetical protein
VCGWRGARNNFWVLVARGPADGCRASMCGCVAWQRPPEHVVPSSGAGGHGPPSRPPRPPRPVAPTRGAQRPYSLCRTRRCGGPRHGRVPRGERHGDTPPAPTCHAQDPRHPARLRSRRTAVRVGLQGWCRPHLPCSVRSPMRARTLADGRGSARSKAVALAHPPGRPRVARGWPRRLASLAWALARIVSQRHQQLLRRRKNLGLHLWTTYWTIHFICFDRSVGRRGVAQLGSAPASGAGGRKFKSSRPDYFKRWVGYSVWGGLEAVMCELFREC